MITRRFVFIVRALDAAPLQQRQTSSKSILSMSNQHRVGRRQRDFSATGQPESLIDRPPASTAGHRGAVRRRTLCTAMPGNMLCRSRSAEWSTNANSRFRATRLDRSPLREFGQPSASSSACKASTQGCIASLHRRIADRLRHPLAAMTSTGAAITSCLVLIKLRSSSGYGSGRWRSGLNRRSRSRARRRPGRSGSPDRRAGRARASGRRSGSRAARSRRSAGRSRRRARRTWSRRFRG